MNVELPQGQPAEIPQANAEDIFVEQILKFDSEGDYGAILVAVKSGAHPPSDIFYCMNQLAIRGRFMSAYVIAKILAGSGVDNPVVDLTRCLGAVIFNNADEEAQASVALGNSLARLPPELLESFRNGVAVPTLHRVIGELFPTADAGFREKIAAIHQIVFAEAQAGRQSKPSVAAKKAAAKPKAAAAKRRKPSAERRPRLDSDTAWRNISTTNPHGKWSIARRKQESATKRLGNRVVLPEFQSAFTIRHDEPIFCMGNCYTHTFEAGLMQLGFKVPSWFVHGSNDTMNRYSNFAILNEFRWALEPERYPFPEECLIKEGNLVADPTMYLSMMPRAAVLDLRQKITETVAHVRDCKVVYLLLGQIEVWFDKKAGVYLADPPVFSACRAEPDRYEVRLTNYAENLECMEEIYRLLMAHCGSDLRLILTVSPTPVITTFTGKDVLLAHSHAKAALRTVIEEFVSRHDNADYYPSYETISYSDRAITWEPDRQHVMPDLVAADTLNFAAHYLPDGEAEAFREKLIELQQRLGNVDGEDVDARPATDRRGPPELEMEDSATVPAGIPEVRATSSHSEFNGPENLGGGPVKVWMATLRPTFPQALMIRYKKPIRAKALWLQCQARHPERGPFSFALFGQVEEGRYDPLLVVDSCRWTEGLEWKDWALTRDGEFQIFQLVILSGANPNYLSLQRFWLEPEGSH